MAFILHDSILREAPSDELAVDLVRDERLQAFRSPKRRRQRSKLDRGLPDDAELVRLAEAYLERQHRNYPAGAANGALPGSNAELLQQMVDDFKHRHRGGTVESAKIETQLKALGITKAGGAYTRFSCNRSNPTSNLDQLVNCLNKSCAEGRFVPWEYVYADFAVTGLDAARRGYSSYKKLLSNSECLIEIWMRHSSFENVLGFSALIPRLSDAGQDF